MKSTSASPALKPSLCAELDALAATSLRRLSIEDARRVLARLRDADAQLCRSAGMTSPAEESSGAAPPCSAKGGTAPSSNACSVETLKQLRSTLAAQLTISQQDVLMRVLYACMASCASGVTSPPFGATCRACTDTYVAHEPLSAADVRRLYEWHAALHDVTGDGAVVRALMSRS
ncbi:hypothetical protein GH5_07941 [Leishmania sp. Ghana 2012 LV757]|uniref:hypothetical protein n=1 Tax=Leishmania sp. Ghana 2012 LV757 TaxID=2803181 RepID=UPI001B76DC39|nr:hypothetical protein GH5_07941 [Leishmania sp. Ghana 2012 LV757]